MSYSDLPPTYEESLKENQKVIYSNMVSKGPDNIYTGNKFMFVDFIPWSENSAGGEDINYLLLRVNDWLLANFQYKVDKCEFIPRMIDSRKKLDLIKCYIFNLTVGRTYFVNQLRLHIYIDESKTEPDRICLKSYIPEIINENSINGNRISCALRFQLHNNSLVFEDMTSLINKINMDIKEGIISGVITNISTFYSKINKDQNSYSKFQSMDNTLFYTDSSEPKCHLKSLRVFYKPGNVIHGKLDVKSFITTNKSRELDQLTENAMALISNMETHNFISMETFPEFEEETRFILQKNIINHNSTFVCGERFIRLESIKVFYFTEGGSILKPLQNLYDPLKILWVVPRKIKKTFESYDSFMTYVDYMISAYDNSIIDMETLYVPNALSWSQVRHQTVVRYHNENCTNYQICALRFILKNDEDFLMKNIPESYNNLSEYSDISKCLT